MRKRIFLILLTAFFLSGATYAQDFGFGFDDETETISNSGRPPAVSIGGEVSAAVVAKFKDYNKDDDDNARADNIRLSDIFSGKLNFFAGVSIAEAYINLNIKPSLSPVSIDEAFLRAFFGGYELEGGLRKITWGKADSFGPLDVINPLDYSDFTDLSNMMNFKIARPLLRHSYRFGSFSKIELVFVPNFEPMRFAEEDKNNQELIKHINDIKSGIKQINEILTLPYVNLAPVYFVENIPDTSTFDYAQAGLRFTTTIGPADIGIQYYYGRLTKPAVTIVYDQPSYIYEIPGIPIPKTPSSIKYSYNPYHQIGVDWAQVFFGFNVRAEFAANITEDLKGDDGGIYNPHLAWSFGFDRNLGWGLNFNFQCNQSIILMHDKIVNDIELDIEADTDITSTQIMASVSKMFLRDQLEIRASIFWQIEVGDFIIIPSVAWTIDAVTVKLSGGTFGGNEDGQFGQYKGNFFIKAGLTYSF